MVNFSPTYSCVCFAFFFSGSDDYIGNSHCSGFKTTWSCGEQEQPWFITQCKFNIYKGKNLNFSSLRKKVIVNRNVPVSSISFSRLFEIAECSRTSIKFVQLQRCLVLPIFYFYLPLNLNSLHLSGFVAVKNYLALFYLYLYFTCLYHRVLLCVQTTFSMIISPFSVPKHPFEQPCFISMPLLKWPPRYRKCTKCCSSIISTIHNRPNQSIEENQSAAKIQ